MRDRQDDMTDPKEFIFPRHRDEGFSALADIRDRPQARAEAAMPTARLPRALERQPFERVPRAPDRRNLREKFADIVKQKIFGMEEGDGQEFSVETTQAVQVMPVLKFKMSFAMA